MTLKIPAADQLRQHILFKGGNSAAVKADALLKDREQGAGKHHVSDAEGRGYRAGKGVQIDDILTGGTRKEGFFRLAEEGKLRFIVVLHQVPVRPGSPAEVFHALGSGGGVPAGEAAEGSDMQYGGLCGPERLGKNAVLSQRTEVHLHIAGTVNLLDLLIGRGFNAVDPAAPQQLHHQAVKVFRTGADDNLVRLDADAPVGFLLSGGLDSSLVCAIAQKMLNKPIRTFAIGMDIDAIDLKYARMVADYIGSDHTEVIINEKDVLEALPTVVELLGTWDITTIRASIGMYLVCKWIHENTDVRVLLTGEISDELFGYKYTDFAPSAAAFQEEAEKRIRELHVYDVLRADRCISYNSLEARVPFGDLKFVRYAMSIDPELKMNNHNMGKYLIRKAFADDHILPDEILWRQKAAFSDAVGHSMVDDLKAFAEKTYTDQEFEEKAAKYDYCRPFTKESLLYRELFEQYYPGQAHMIPDFWMPNKTWPGCNVNDPSARVLANYGQSGQ